MKTQGSQGSMALFEEYPALGDKLNWSPIGFYPTPVEEKPELAERTGVGRLFIKRDDLSHPDYGGNKIRKLDFLLAEAAKRGARTIITFGGIGSNHFLATAIHAASRGIKTAGVLVPQPVTPAVKRNMLCYLHYGAELNLAEGGYKEVPFETLKVAARHSFNDGRPPFIIPAGGSSVSGVLGYINAAFELKKQIEAGDIPEPDYIFAAVGTCGTVSGLIAGCAAAGLKSRVVGVKVTDWVAANTFALSSLANQATFKLFSIDQSFPVRVFTPFNVELLTEFFGGEYGRVTPESADAISMCADCAGVKLEGVYTGKAFAGLVHTAKTRDLADKTVLFWNTYNSVDMSGIAAQHDYSELPPEFHRFFESPESES
ncbi:MAG TPA: pyridoxal-phosphate dependent enzyme [bacterium]|nr:pyridoxal-phosphate dependent enzyme [bacterium]